MNKYTSTQYTTKINGKVVTVKLNKLSELGE